MKKISLFLIVCLPLISSCDKDELISEEMVVEEAQLKSTTSVYLSENYLIGDVNGDGKDDIIKLTKENGWHVSYSGTSPWEKICNSATVKDQLLIGDFNGDGKLW